MNKHWYITGAAILLIAALLFLFIWPPPLFRQLLLQRLAKEAHVSLEGGEIKNLNLWTYLVRDVRFRLSPSFAFTVKEGYIHCSPLSLVSGLRLPMELGLRGVRFEFKDEMLKAIGLSEIFCDSINAHFAIDARKKIEILNFVASGKEGNLYLGGFIEGSRNIDIKLRGFLSRSVLERLPEFISSNLFYEDDLPLKEIRFSIRGNPKRPNVEFGTDLVQLVVRDHAKTK
ncbi:MAG: hypothetical protein PHE61_01270 [Candidatus Omnitrophica bacterium]|nr:hypothetical protein [Candidatus Omnitrophota bacterium]